MFSVQIEKILGHRIEVSVKCGHRDTSVIYKVKPLHGKCIEVQRDEFHGDSIELLQVYWEEAFKLNHSRFDMTALKRFIAQQEKQAIITVLEAQVNELCEANDNGNRSSKAEVDADGETDTDGDHDKISKRSKQKSDDKQNGDSGQSKRMERKRARSKIQQADRIAAGQQRPGDDDGPPRKRRKRKTPKKQLIKASNSKPEQELLKCPDCGNMLSGKRNLKRHRILHLPNKGRIKCKKCGMWKAKSYINKHEATCTGTLFKKTKNDDNDDEDDDKEDEVYDADDDKRGDVDDDEDYNKSDDEENMNETMTLTW